MLIADGYDTYRDYLRRMQPRIHGMAIFDTEDRAWAQRNNHWLALARANEELVGLMLYDLKGEKVTDFNLRAIRFH